MRLVRSLSPAARRRWQIAQSLSLVAACFLFLKADQCPDKSVTDPDAVIVRADVTPDSITLAPGASGSMTSFAYDDKDRSIRGRQASWRSSNPAVATVAADGEARAVITAVAAGTADIIMTVDGQSAKGRVVVAVPTVPIAKMTLIVSGSDMRLLDSTYALAMLEDAAGNELTGRVIAYTSSDPSVAAVVPRPGTDGADVIARKLGSATITATVEGLTRSSVVNVTRGPMPRGLNVSVDTVRAVVGADASVTLVALDGAGTAMPDTVIEVAIADAGIARVSAPTTTGRAPIRISGVAAGTTTLDVHVGVVNRKIPVVISAPAPVGANRVAISPKTLQLKAGQTANFTATVVTATGAPYTGTVGFRAVGTGASITAAGKLSATQPGNVLVIASADAVADTAQVTVVGVDSLRLAPRGAVSLPVGGSIARSAKVYGGGKALAGETITWSSTSTSVVEVAPGDDYAVVYAKVAGTATVVASSGGKSDTATFTVTPAAPAGGSTLTVHPLGVFTVKRLADNTTQTFPSVMFAGDHEENGDKSLQAFASYLFTELPATATVTKAELKVAFDPQVSGTPFAGGLGALVVELASSSTLNEGAVSTSAVVVATAMATSVTVDVLPLVRAARSAGQQSATLRFRFVNLVNGNRITDNVGFYADPLTLTYSTGGAVRATRGR